MGEIEKLVEKGDRREDAVFGGDDERSAGGENSSKSPIIWDKGLDGGSAGVGLTPSNSCSRGVLPFSAAAASAVVVVIAVAVAVAVTVFLT
ncbi:hypothetical protein GUJ93_ZPchr0011g28545 [Zizania palustris]|uniref:Uncharacterized protein n=1 Tax=Zizania palustris TaxID=103762 RepID=A0A8J5WIL2_ZIZPA|nr:hypothetical protein GUJ93_ZPchr0011g28545 [Zizania palustris]